MLLLFLVLHQLLITGIVVFLWVIETPFSFPSQFFSPSFQFSAETLAKPLKEERCGVLVEEVLGKASLRRAFKLGIGLQLLQQVGVQYSRAH